MRKVLSVLGRKKLQLFFLFYIVLTLPVLSCMAENLTFSDRVLLLVVNLFLFGAMSVLSVFCKPRTEKIIYLCLFFVALIPGLIYIGYLLFAHVFLQQNSIISLFETNPEESREFVVHYFSKWLVLGQSLYVLLCLLVVWKMRSFTPLKFKNHRKVFIGALAVLLLICSVPYLSKQVYFINFYKLFVEYKLRLKHEQTVITERQSQPYDVKRLQSDTISQIMVVVIGESLTRTHMALYGYGRDTNPQLSLLGDSLLVYKDVVSPQVHTIPVLRSVLTLADKDNPNYVTEKPSLFELFNRAGYDTYFISNQPFGGKIKTSYDAFLNLAQFKSNVSTEKQPDEVVLPVLKDIVQKKDKKNKLILIHLIGNHMAYEFRYTPSFNVFDFKKDHFISDTDFRDAKAKKTIDRYDNSVLYNDFIISQIIDVLKKQPNSNSGMIYFSDHGEEVYETREFAGHAYEKVTSYMCEVPFLVWMSDRLKHKRSDLVLDINRSFSTCDFLYSLSDLAGLNYIDYTDTKSVFSTNFKSVQRYVGSLTYEEVKVKKPKK